jgi:hypothetical protein
MNVFKTLKSRVYVYNEILFVFLDHDCTLNLCITSVQIISVSKVKKWIFLSLSIVLVSYPNACIIKLSFY